MLARMDAMHYPYWGGLWVCHGANQQQAHKEGVPDGCGAVWSVQGIRELTKHGNAGHLGAGLRGCATHGVPWQSCRSGRAGRNPHTLMSVPKASRHGESRCSCPSRLLPMAPYARIHGNCLALGYPVTAASPAAAFFSTFKETPAGSPPTEPSAKPLPVRTGPQPLAPGMAVTGRRPGKATSSVRDLTRLHPAPQKRSTPCRPAAPAAPAGLLLPLLLSSSAPAVVATARLATMPPME